MEQILNSVSGNLPTIISGVLIAVVTALSVYISWRSHRSSHEATPPALLRFSKWVDVYCDLKNIGLSPDDDNRLKEALDMHKEYALWENKVIDKTQPGRIRDIIINQHFLSGERIRDIRWFPVWKFQISKISITSLIIILLFIRYLYINTDYSHILFILAFFSFDLIISWMSLYRVSNVYYKSIEYKKSKEDYKWLELYSILFNGYGLITERMNSERSPGIIRAGWKYCKMITYHMLCLIFTNYVIIISLVFLFFGDNFLYSSKPSDYKIHMSEYTIIILFYSFIYNMVYIIDRKYIYFPDVIKYPHRESLEGHVLELGIEQKRVESRLLSLEPRKGNEKYPKLLLSLFTIRNIGYLILTFLYLIFIILVPENFKVFYMYLFCFLLVYGIFLYTLQKRIVIKYSIILRNGYHALKRVYLSDINIVLKEDKSEIKERNKFIKTKKYKEWKKEMDKKGLDWSSWNYGLSIDKDNNPEKTKVNDTKKDSSIEYYI